MSHYSASSGASHYFSVKSDTMIDIQCRQVLLSYWQQQLQAVRGTSGLSLCIFHIFLQCAVLNSARTAEKIKVSCSPGNQMVTDGFIARVNDRKYVLMLKQD
jgi:primosomal replication protein N